MEKLIRVFMNKGMDKDEAKGVAYTLRDEVKRTLRSGNLEDDDTLDELECIFANYELELDWLWNINWTK